MDTSKMHINGYSERGAINALFYEIAYSGRSLDLMQRLLGLAHFPNSGRIGAGLTHSQVFIEQSLSDFGDADAILLLDAGPKKTAVFLEAKVKPSQAKSWTLDQEFGRFKEGWDNELSSSNLFTQLYHKARCMEGLRSGGVGALRSGLEFPACSAKQRRKIGSNPVVLRLLGCITPYCKDVWYLSLVPVSAAAIRVFFENFAMFVADIVGLDAARWGGMAWEQVAEFSESENLQNTCGVFEFNKGQIYKQSSAPSGPP